MKITITLFLIYISQSVFADTQSDSDTLFNWAETQYSGFFSPPNQSSQIFDTYYYRYYPVTNNYLGVNTVDLDVHVLGDVFGGLLRVDTLASLLAIVDPGNTPTSTPISGCTSAPSYISKTYPSLSALRTFENKIVNANCEEVVLRGV